MYNAENKQHLYSDFVTIGKRIAAARAGKGWTQSELARQIGVKPQSVQLWEADATAPSRKRIESVAELLDTTPEELLFDVPPSRGRPRRGKPFIGDRENVVVSAYGDQIVPVCDYQQAAEWTASDKPYPITARTENVWTNIENLTDRAFGLVIEGESMLDEFYPGDIVILDPELPPQPGDFVVAKLDKEEKVTLRKYRPRGFDDKGKPVIELAPLNDDYPMLVIDQRNKGRVIATMVEHRKYRRRNRLTSLKSRSPVERQ
ncbi:MAG: helix-turn-helix domain-containing protein [Gammaproteobacteria bacterium]